MFSSSTPNDTQPNKQQPTLGKQMGKGSPNADTTRKGTFEGTKKSPVKHESTPKGAKTANAGKSNFGRAVSLGGGKHNFSRGAPGHSSHTS